MSILQEYEKHTSLIGKDKMNAIQEYLDAKENNNQLFYSDIVYKKEEWEKFEKWYNNKYGKSSEGDRKV